MFIQEGAKVDRGKRLEERGPTSQKVNPKKKKAKKEKAQRRRMQEKDRWEQPGNVLGRIKAQEHRMEKQGERKIKKK